MIYNILQFSFKNMNDNLNEKQWLNFVRNISSPIDNGLIHLNSIDEEI